MKKKIILVGAGGKMGSLIHKSLKDDFEIIPIEKQDNIWNFESDLVIDFGSAESSAESAKFCFQNKVPLIVGATGQTQKQIDLILKVGEVAPVMKASNFSLGVLFVKNMLTQISKHADDICLFEKHHKHKKDSPSGTAIELKTLIENNTGKSVSVLAQRGGDEVGSHTIDFYFSGEVVSLSHQAFSREAFVQGVKKAVYFLLEQKMPRVYEFGEIIKNNKL